jgi:hypothetical protein
MLMTMDLTAEPMSGLFPRPKPVELIVTLWPDFPHFHRFANDPRIQGIRLNSAMMEASEIDDNFEMEVERTTVPLWFDIKAMQLRITELVCGMDCDHLECRINHPIECETPCQVWFKGGENMAILDHIDDDVLVFDGGPSDRNGDCWEVRVGESLQIRDPNLVVGGDIITEVEVEKVRRARELGFTRFYLSYVYHQDHVDAIRRLIGPNAELALKIENVAGLKWVQNGYRFLDNGYRPQHNTRLVAARGDLFVEIPRPHQIMTACNTIIRVDADAIVGSRMLLSCIHRNVPDCSDLNELAWLYEAGFRSFLLCDELCLEEELLARAVNVFDAFREEYVENPTSW